MTEWLLRTALDLSLLIGLTLLVRPFVRRYLGASAAYLLWLLPPLRVAIVDRPSRPADVFALREPAVGTAVGSAYDAFETAVHSAVVGADGVPWLSVWLTGLLVSSLLGIFSWQRLRQAMRTRSEPIDPPVALLDELPNWLRSSNTKFHLTDETRNPFVTGLRRPLIFLPRDFFSAYSLQQQRWVIQHELTHWFRGDLWVRLAWEGLRAVFWFNPLVHLAARALRADQELACDEAILGSRGNEDRYEYGRALLVAARAYEPHRLLSFFDGRKERIAMLERHRRSRARALAGLCVCCSLGLLVLTRPPDVLAQIQPTTTPASETEPGDESASQVVADEWTGRVQRIVEDAESKGWLSMPAVDPVVAGLRISARAASNGRVSSLMRVFQDGAFDFALTRIQNDSAGITRFELIVRRPAPTATSN